MYKRGIQRNYEIIEIYNIRLEQCIKEGKTHKEAMLIAYNDIELMFNLSRRRSSCIVREGTNLTPLEKEECAVQFQIDIEKIMTNARLINKRIKRQ